MIILLPRITEALCGVGVHTRATQHIARVILLLKTNTKKATEFHTYADDIYQDTTSQQSKSGIGRRQWAPEHFAFCSAEREYYDRRMGRKHVLYRSSLWVMSAGFVIRGGWGLFFLPRTAWTFPIVNDRLLLILHWTVWTPFLTGIMW